MDIFKQKNVDLVRDENYYGFKAIELLEACGVKISRDDIFMYANGNKRLEFVNYVMGIASESDYLEIVKFFIENGANVSFQDNYAIKSASKNGHLKVVKYLVEKGADITAQDNYAIKNASKNGHLKVVKYLSDSLLLSELENYNLCSDINNIIIEY